MPDSTGPEESESVGTNDDAGPFSIGQGQWPGLAKLAEECGEVIQIIGKLIATGGRTDHWSGLNLERELEDEIGDVQAACAFVIEKCYLDRARIEHRTDQKQMLFGRWHGDTFHQQEMTAFLRHERVPLAEQMASRLPKEYRYA